MLNHYLRGKKNTKPFLGVNIMLQKIQIQIKNKNNSEVPYKKIMVEPTPHLLKSLCDNPKCNKYVGIKRKNKKWEHHYCSHACRGAHKSILSKTVLITTGVRSKGVDTKRKVDGIINDWKMCPTCGARLSARKNKFCSRKCSAINRESNRRKMRE